MMNELELIDCLCRIHRALLVYIERNTIMPRGVKRINNGPVDVPLPTPEEKTVATEAAVAEARAYRSRGKDTPAVPERPFGPGADYPRYTYQLRLYDPVNKTVSTYTASDIQALEWQQHVDGLIESGLLPCSYIDAPKQQETRVNTEPDDDIMDNDRAAGRKARSRDLTLTFGIYEGKTIRQVYNSGSRGQSYVEWLSREAKDRDIRNAARDILE